MTPSEDDQGEPGGDADVKTSCKLTAGGAFVALFVVTQQQLPGNVFDRIISRHFAKLHHLRTLILSHQPVP